MPETLIKILKGLQSDPTLAIGPYKEIFENSFFALVRKDTENSFETMEFVTYATEDNLTELPLFTHENFIFNSYPKDAVEVRVLGEQLWGKLLTIVETGKCEAAINPGQTHGIRLTREMILGMFVKYGTSLQ
ncbi:MAG: SseB family protein [Chitinophagaceae bacterium]